MDNECNLTYFCTFAPQQTINDMKIGLVVAMEKEYDRVAALLDVRKDEELDGVSYAVGHIGRNEIVMVRSGIGKVNAAISAMRLISLFKPDALVSTGVAGGASTVLNVEDVVVSTELCYHDAYCGADNAPGQIQGLPARFVAAERLVATARGLQCGVKIVTGLIVTGDWFVDSREKMAQIVSVFPDAMAVDMESAALAHVCHVCGVPFVSFRIISDIPLKDHKASQYFDFWKCIADSSFAVTRNFLESVG